MKKAFALTLLIVLCARPTFAQTHSSATVMQVVTANAAIAATVKATSSLNPATIGTKVTYTVNVTGSNNGSTPQGTVVVVGLTGTQTVNLVSGSATCSETPTAATPATGTAVTFTFNSSDGNFF